MDERSERGEHASEAMDADLVAPSLLHELKQPLMGADAAATLLERALPPLGDTADWRMLRGQLARLAEIVSGYEDLLRAGDAAAGPFAVGAVVSRAVELLAHRVRPLASRFQFTREGGEREGYGTPTALVHAATNLLVNAIDAVEDTGREGRIAVRVLPGEAGATEVRVSDEGIGIPPELRGRVFEPRFTTKAPGRGSGLGLHVARRLMNRHGGAVFLVEQADPTRLPWAVTEFCVAVPAPPARGAP